VTEAEAGGAVARLKGIGDVSRVWLIGGATVVTGALIASGVAIAFPHEDTKTATAYFTRAVGVYQGSEVRVLGVKIGSVTKVTPEGNRVRVDMRYEARRKIPSNAQAVVVAASIVSDRYVQFTPVYRGGPVMASRATIPLSRTATPVELDEAFGTTSDLAKALGPNGANRNGSLSRLLSVGAKNLKGTGGDFRSTVRDMADAAAALSSDSGDTATSIRNLNKFTTALARSNDQYVSFSRDMTAVAGQLNGERGELRAVLQVLGPTLRNVAKFVRDNKKSINTSVTGLGKLSDIVARNKKGLAGFLDSAPTGIENAAMTYDPISGTLMSRINIQQTDNLAMWLCSLAYSLGAPSKQCESLLKPINFLGGPISKILTIDPSFITKITTTYDVKQPPPDAYGPGQKPAKTSKSRVQSRGMPGGPPATDPTLGGILNR
jgi:phospholipid/cholesterol/gamma-HCH transport system substrate-binding protein